MPTPSVPGTSVPGTEGVGIGLNENPPVMRGVLFVWGPDDPHR